MKTGQIKVAMPVDGDKLAWQLVSSPHPLTARMEAEHAAAFASLGDGGEFFRQATRATAVAVADEAEARRLAAEQMAAWGDQD